VIKRENGATPVPVSKAPIASSFLGILADMEKKPEKEIKKEVEIPNETEEERATRLRKEERRKLRVSWKTDESLVEIRFFTHDPEEELGQGDKLKANAGGGREGEALKGNKSIEELDDDEDEDSFEDFEEYRPPSEVDFSVLEDPAAGDDSPHRLNMSKFGGMSKPESRSFEAQEKYEQDTLMAIYTTKADRPPTPKELDATKDEDDFEPAEPETPFGEPEEKTRAREKEFLARQMAVKPIQPPMMDINLLVQNMAQRTQQPPAPPATTLPFNLQALSQYAQPAPVIPQPPQQAAAPPVDLAAILAALQNQSQPQPPPPPQYPAVTSAPAFPPGNISALLASMQQVQQGTSINSLSIGTGTNPNPFPGAYDDSSRKHGRAESADGNDEYGQNKKKRSDWWNANNGVGGKPANYKTQVCTFWEQGRCTKGDSCTYRHGDD
jgi:hypothetical protein